MGNKIGVPVAQGLDVPKFFKNVPNFVKDVPRGPKWGLTSNHFLRVFKRINGPWKRRKVSR